MFRKTLLCHYRMDVLWTYLLSFCPAHNGGYNSKPGTIRVVVLSNEFFPKQMVLKQPQKFLNGLMVQFHHRYHVEVKLQPFLHLHYPWVLLRRLVKNVLVLKLYIPLATSQGFLICELLYQQYLQCICLQIFFIPMLHFCKFYLVHNSP